MLTGQLAAERAAHAIDRATKDRTVGPREVDQLEDAPLRRLRGQRRQRFDLGRRPLNPEKFAGLQLADRRRAHQVERARLRRDHVALAKLAEPERPEAAWIDDRIQRAADRDDQRVRALDAPQRSEQRILGLARFGARDEVNQHFTVDEVWKIEPLATRSARSAWAF